MPTADEPVTAQAYGYEYGVSRFQKNTYEIYDHRLDGKKIANVIFMPKTLR